MNPSESSSDQDFRDLAVAVMPGDQGGPVFAAPWQAQAFAMTVKLHEGGLFEWSEWADYLGAELAAAGPTDTADDYYTHWLAALEKIVVAKQAMSDTERLACVDAWDRAAKATPHGQPIELPDPRN